MSSTSTSSAQYLKTIGIVNNGYNGRGFANPYDLAVSEEGNLFVLNRCDPARRSAIRVGVCNLDEDYLFEFGFGFGDGDGQLVWPVGIDFDKNSRVLVSDEHNNRITIYSSEGKYVSHWGQQGKNQGEFEGPSGLAVTEDNVVFISDQKNHRIQQYKPDGSFIAQWGEYGSGEGQFNLPWGITFDAQDRLYVSDWRNDRVQVFTRDGQFLNAIGSSGSGEGELSRPSSVAVDSRGDVYVADWGNERVQVFDSEGLFKYSLRGQATLSQWAIEFFESNPDEMEQREISELEPEIPDHLDSPHHISSQTESFFWGPVSVVIDQNDLLYVVESNRHRIQVYEIR